MFIECQACAGDGEGVYGHSWTTCPVCHGAGQVFVPVAQPVIDVKVRGRSAFNGPDFEDVNPTGVFPDPSYRKRALASV